MSRPSLCLSALPLALLAVAACHSPAERVPGDAKDHHPWNGIAAGETVRFLGTEPFWGGSVGPEGLTYTTPGNEKGETVPASRFAGRGGVSFSGTLAAGAATLVVTPAPCSDGMSDAHYPFIVTLQIGSETRNGCGWTDRRPRSSGG
ncbi:COG3650 family protein [Novosphingobium sp. BL-52-GroH]|uniref:COG3650 family protein n=1 Tax=Novosphingobium sp. BL-52-GroH TaxID=3349877 RepID=UPI00384A54F6